MSTFANKNKRIVGMNWNYLVKAAKIIFNIVITDSLRGFAHLSPKAEENFKDDENVKEMMAKFNDEYLEKGWGLLLTCLRCLDLTFIILSILFLGNSDYSKIIFYQWPIIFIIIAILDKLFQNFKKYRGLILSIMIYFIGSVMIYRSMSRATYALYENWLIFI